MSEPKIPHGYRQVQGRSQKGDGVWDGTRFRKVKKEYPVVRYPEVMIRRCEVVQPELTMEAASELAKAAAPLVERAEAAMDEARDSMIEGMCLDE